MSNTQKRPKITPKPAKNEPTVDEALDAGLKLVLDGVTYEARLGDVTPEINRELRRNIGMGFYALIEEAARFPDNDLISAFVWVARRINGEHIAFDAVSVTYAQILDDSTELSLPGSEQVDDTDPEA